MTKFLLDDDVCETSFEEVAEQARQEAERHAAQHAAGQRLYAKIKDSSKYFYQNEIAQRSPERFGWPFAIVIAPGDSDHVVNGGPGGRYRLSDVHIFVVTEDGQEVQIS